MVKVSQQLGYYLEGTASNLSSNFSLQDKEQTVLHLRYGNFNMLYLTHLISGLKDFKVFKFKWFGSYHDMQQWTLENKFAYVKKFPMIIISVIKWPRHMVRKYLKKYITRIREQKQHSIQA